MNPTLLPQKPALTPSETAVASLNVTVIIVNWNSGTMLRNCLGPLQRKFGGGLQVKTIVVDNHSKDGSPDLVEREFPNVRLIRTGKNLGFGRGNNVAQPHTAPGYVLFLNPDTELQDGAIESMVKFLESHPETGAIGCQMIFPSGEVADQNLQWFPYPLTEFIRHAFLTEGLVRSLAGILPWNDPTHSGYVQKLYGGCFLARTAVLDKTGWFDERFFMYGEDVDLSRRIREAGWQLYYSTDARLMHEAGGTTEKAGSGFSILMSCESIAKLIEKYQGRLSAFGYRVSVGLGSLIRLGLLSPFALASLVRGADKRASCRAAMASCWLRFQWAAGLKSVFIPK